MAVRSELRRNWEATQQRMGRVPLRIKLITAVLALVTIALAAISVAGVSFLRTYLLGQADGNLVVVGDGFGRSQVIGCLTGSLPNCPSAGPSGWALDWVPGSSGHPRPMWRTVSGVGAQRTIPGPAIVPSLRWLAQHPGQATTVPALSGSGQWRVLAIPIRLQVSSPESLIAPITVSGLAVTGYDLTGVYNTLGRLVRIDVIVSAVVLTGLAMAGIAIVRSSLQPLADIETTAGKIASGDLTQRVPERDPATEVGRLGRSLNAMLTQIETAFRAAARSEAAARASEEKMRRFVADASHELRTPVTVVRGYAEYYRQRGGEAGGLAGPEVDRIMERVERESARMGGLVEDLLLLARLDQQRPLERRPVDLVTLAVDAVQDAGTVAPDRDITLSVDPGTAPIVLGDEPRLRQVVGNLMSNALTHTPPGTPVTVRVLTRQHDAALGYHNGSVPGPSAVLEVADRGPGLSAEQAERVFERFYRGDQARNRRTGGTGLGLAIVAALVSAHDGTVSLDTSSGSGATFRITLPLSPEAQGHDEDPLEDMPEETGQP
ncbi:MAG TPA: HAMP domain-containing sensor histidine kinase [Streptosporangiaceae bacterium]|nr:HAMP domain-containing sensor histidine kinase [Streptosporangiaceae bacterium]